MTNALSMLRDLQHGGRTNAPTVYGLAGCAMFENLNKTDQKCIRSLARGGFTWSGDSIFRTYNSGVRCLRRLKARGIIEGDCGCNTYRLTDAARDELHVFFLIYGDTGDA